MKQQYHIFTMVCIHFFVMYCICKFFLTEIVWLLIFFHLSVKPQFVHLLTTSFHTAQTSFKKCVPCFNKQQDYCAYRSIIPKKRLIIHNSP